MAKISYSPTQGFGDQIFAPLGDGRFIQLLEGNLDYPDEAAHKLINSRNPSVQSMIRQGIIAIFVDSSQPQSFDMAPGAYQGGNGMQMAPLTPVDVGLGINNAQGQPMMTNNQQAIGGPTYGMQTAANGQLIGNAGQGVLMNNGSGAYVPGGQGVVTATDAPQNVPQIRDRRGNVIQDLQPTMAPEMPPIQSGVAPELEGSQIVQQQSAVRPPVNQEQFQQPPAPAPTPDVDPALAAMTPPMQSESVVAPEAVTKAADEGATTRKAATTKRTPKRRKKTASGE